MERLEECEHADKFEELKIKSNEGCCEIGNNGYCQYNVNCPEYKTCQAYHGEY